MSRASATRGSRLTVSTTLLTVSVSIIVPTWTGGLCAVDIGWHNTAEAAPSSAGTPTGSERRGPTDRVDPSDAGSSTPPKRTSRDPTAIRALPLALMATTLIALVAILGMIVIRRTWRRHFFTPARREARPTAAEDVWAMHRLPGEPDRGAGGRSADDGDEVRDGD